MVLTGYAIIVAAKKQFMPILKRYPVERPIKDYRSAGRGYYEAACDFCGRIYYPFKSDAKYCSQSCRQQAHVKHKGGRLEPKVDTKKPVVTKLKPVAPAKQQVIIVYEQDNPNVPPVYYNPVTGNLYSKTFDMCKADATQFDQADGQQVLDALKQQFPNRRLKLVSV